MKRPILLAIFSLLFYSASHILHAADIPVASGGDILAAIAGANAGDVIVLEDGGTYSIGATLELTKTITIAAADAAVVKPKINFTAEVHSGGANGAGITFRGVEIIGSGGSSFFMVTGGTDSISHVKFIDTNLHGFGRSVIRSSNAGTILDTLVVENSHFYDFTSSTWRVFWLRGNDIDYVSFKNSTFERFTESVLYIEGDDPSVTNVEIDHCTVHKKTLIDNNSIFHVFGSMGGYLKVSNSIFTNLESNNFLFNVDTTFADSISNSRFYFEGNTIDTTNTWNYKSDFLAADPQYLDTASNSLFVQNADFYTASTTGGLIGDPRWDKNTNANLSSLTIDGTEVNGFAPATLSYDVELAPGTTTIPTVDFVLEDTTAGAVVNAATSLPGVTTVVVTAGNGTITQTYTINFTVLTSLSDDATLSEILVDGVAITLTDEVLEYTVSLPFGTTEVPEVEVTTTHAGATPVITPATSIPGETTIVVTAEDGTTSLTYTMSFELLPDLKTILFVGSAGNVDDEVLIDSLSNFGSGYNVTFVEGGVFNSTYTTAEAYEGFSLIFISESIGSSNGNAYGAAGFPIPGFLSEPYLLNKANILLGSVPASGQQDILPRMKIENSSHPITAGVYDLDEEVQVLDGEAGIFQYEVQINDGVLYEVLGKPVIEDTVTDANIYVGGPSWLIFESDQTISLEPLIEIPDSVEIILHAFHSGSATNSTDEYWTQVRRSVLYLLGDLSTGGETGLDSDNLHQVNVYPNPSRGITHLDFEMDKSATASLSILNLEGKVLKTIDLGYRRSGKNSASVNLSELAAGLYMFKLEIDGSLTSGRIMKVD